MFAALFGAKRASPAQDRRKSTWKKASSHAPVISQARIARALRGKTLTVPGKGCTIRALGFSVSITIHPVVVGGDVTVTIIPSKGMTLPSRIGILTLTEHNGELHKSFGSTGVATINGVVRGSYRLSLT